MPGLPCLQCFFTGACCGACGAAWSCDLILRTLPRALRWAAFQRSQPEVRRGSQAALRCVAVWPSKSRGSLHRSPVALGGVAAATHVSRCLLVSYMSLARKIGRLDKLVGLEFCSFYLFDTHTASLLCAPSARVLCTDA